MEQRFSMAGGGWLVVRAEGLRAIIRAERPNDGRGLYKAWLLGRTGQYPLGTLVPEEGHSLVLQRSVSLDELRRKGVWPPIGAEARLSFSFQGPETPPGWEPARHPGELFRDGLLSRAAEQLTGALLRRTAEGFSLAAPYGAERDFPLLPAFCFARVSELGDKAYAIFSFDRDGWPICSE